MRFLFTACSFMFTWISVTSASAAIVLSGNFTTLTPTVDVRPNVTRSDTNTFFFQEQDNFQLTSSLAANITAPGTANIGNGFDPSPGTINANQQIDVFFVHTDPLTPTPHTFIGSIQFDTPVLGIITRPAALLASSFLQLPAPSLYPISGGGAVENAGDSISLDPTGRIVSFNLVTAGGEDDFRIVVAAPPATVPEPASLVLMFGGLSLATFGAYRQRRSQTETTRICSA